ncbi:MAG: hypothetical protein KJ066_16305 [Acidobacteria bacterium]|nr:hypothetical protein [Acidobacteriota bacterium]
MGTEQGQSTRPRGRPRALRPTGTWVDSLLLERRVKRLLPTGDARDDDETITATVDALCRLTRRLLRRPVTTAQRARLRRLLCRRPQRADVVLRQLYQWRHGLGDRDVRRMLKSRREGRPPVKMIYR